MRRSEQRQRGRADAGTPADIGAHSTVNRAYDPITTEEADRILAAAIAYVAEVGVRFEPGTEADAIFAGAGCTVGGGVVRIPPEITRETLRRCAKSVRLWNRDGSRHLDLDKDHCWFIPGMTCIRVYDWDTGAPRDSTLADLARITLIADGLEHIDAVCVACKDIPNSTPAGEIGEFLCLVENTSKPLEFLCEHDITLRAAIEMAAELRGGRDALRERPYFLHIVTPLPASYAATHVEQILTCVRAGVPVVSGTVAFGGATSPITVAGCVVHALATDFAAMVLAQLAVPGSFCIGSGMAYFMEAATGAIGSIAQVMLGEQIICQIRRQLGIPSFTAFAGRVKARRFNQDAVWELSTLLTQVYFCRPATCDYLGLHDNGMTYSIHSLMLANDLAGLLRTLWRGAPVTEDQIALDIARDIGPFGNYLGHVHTARHCREANWPSIYLGANAPLSTTDKPDLDLKERIDLDLAKRLASPGPDPLPADLLSRLRSIHDAYAAR
ncbi:MAG: trimethylamine methyltransferase family protein [Rhodobacteraceae bacterium]|uniref:trimethylamine methyltransferase family protein n=1 Tax=Albidovulum sp. TaxID=1872424 RepID=UPI001D963F4F|nr:trimethylamine methyltransferase family protein [uncultured Defluviimonas sp.]MCB2125726.1 trimethylamine methyltransferase family protein [Paracoccaceae bacterium]MCC0068985.1 trimethylamine methyltransferase family protein [Paracoccaceae bacterium]